MNDPKPLQNLLESPGYAGRTRYTQLEYEAQRAFLKSCGCDFIQGFLVGRPADSDTAAKHYV